MSIEGAILVFGPEKHPSGYDMVTAKGPARPLKEAMERVARATTLLQPGQYLKIELFRDGKFVGNFDPEVIRAVADSLR